MDTAVDPATVTVMDIIRHTESIPRLKGGFNIRRKRQCHTADGRLYTIFAGTRFFFRASDTSAPTPDQILLDMERVGKNKNGDFTAYGRVYALVTLKELLALMYSLHSWDRHLYESLGDRPHKLVLDIDKPLAADMSWQDVERFDTILENTFVPFLCDFLNRHVGVRAADHTTSPGTWVCPGDILVLDASRAQKKYSKHLIVNTPQVVCSPDRSSEQALMRVFEFELGRECARNSPLRGLCEHHDGGDIVSSVDFSIYTKGKRSMRLPACCKGTGKTLRGPVRLLLPAQRDLHRPFVSYVCNVFGGSKCVWAFRSGRLARSVTAAQNRKRKRGRTGATTVTTDDIYIRRTTDLSAVPIKVIDCVKWVTTRLHPHTHSVSMHYEIREDACPCVTAVINYASAPDQDRTCAFGFDTHNRHYSTVSVYANGEADYYCYGCRERVVLVDKKGAAANSPPPLPFASFYDTAYGQGVGGRGLRCIQSRYLPPCPLKPSMGTRESLLMKSGMGTGKTKVIADYLNSVNERSSVLCVCFRQTLTASLAERFGLINYMDRMGHCLYDCERLAIQLDSLPRLLRPITTEGGQFTMRKSYDVVIIDEMESLLTHFTSSTMAHKSYLCWQLLDCIVRNCHKFIACDADLGPRGLAYTQPRRPIVSTTVIHNTHVGSSVKHIIVHNTTVFTKRLLSHVIRGKRTAYVASNSRAYAHFICGELRKKGMADHEFLLIEGDSDNEIKLLAASHCDEIWTRYKVVLCTPAVAAGVDFSASHFDDVFVYGTNTSCCARELHQQRGRVRHVKSGKVFVCIDATPPQPPLEENVGEIQCSIQQRTASVLKDMQVHLREHEERVVATTTCPPSLLYLASQSFAERNRSRNDMLHEYVSVLHDNGVPTDTAVKRLPVSKDRYMNILNMRLRTYDIEAQMARDMAAIPLGGGDNELHRRKQQVCEFYGGADITHGTLMQVLMGQGVMSAVHRWLESILTDEELVGSSISGPLGPLTFSTESSTTNVVVPQRLALELDRPSFARKHALKMMLYAAGCRSVVWDGNGPVCQDDLPLACCLAADGIMKSCSERRLREPGVKKWVAENRWFLRLEEGVSVTAKTILVACKKKMGRDYAVAWCPATRMGAGSVYVQDEEGSNRRRRVHITVTHVLPEMIRVLVLAAALRIRTTTIQEGSRDQIQRAVNTITNGAVTSLSPIDIMPVLEATVDAIDVEGMALAKMKKIAARCFHSAPTSEEEPEGVWGNLDIDSLQLKVEDVCQCLCNQMGVE